MNRKSCFGCIGVLAVTVVLTVVIVALAALGGTMYNRWRDARDRERYPLACTELVEKYSAENGLPATLVYAVIRTESMFDADIVSPVGAVGLMQLMDVTAEWALWRLGEDTEPLPDLTDAETNVRIGCWVLAYMLNRYGDVDTALAAYNAGAGRVDEWLADGRYASDGVLTDIPIAETAAYVAAVTKAELMYRTLYFETETP